MKLVKNEAAFRKVFGDENRQEILISFLNVVTDHSILDIALWD